MPGSRQVQRSLVRLMVVLGTWDPVEAVVLHSATTADHATLAFHQARQRLIQNRVTGELLIVRHDDETRMLLRELPGQNAEYRPQQARSDEERADPRLRCHEPYEALGETFLERLAVEVLLIRRVQRHYPTA